MKLFKNHPLFAELNVRPTFRCVTCQETLLYGRKTCPYCNTPVNQEHALRSARYHTAINRACSWANTIRTTSIAMPIFAASIVISHLLQSKILMISPILSSAIYCLAIGAWMTKYGDVTVSNAEFTETKEMMKRYFDRWLAFTVFQIFLVFVW